MKIKKYLLEIFIIMIIVCTFFTHSYALDPKTHEDLNEYIANNTIDGFSLNAYLQDKLGLQEGIEESFNSKRVWKWLRDGGKYEDEPPWTIPYLRSVNHFHNPLEPDIEKAGFTGIWGTGILSGKSSILWSQKPAGEQSPGGYYSWHDARGYFYTALTATDKATQDSNFAETFRALGQLMHLVQDISVPAHTRDDGHVMYNYETWVKNYFIKYADLYNHLSIYPPISFDKSAIGNSNSQASVPVANLFDTTQYNGSNPVTTLQSNIGLSEYTNANFLSSDTMFTDDFPFPKAEHCVIVFDTPPNGIPDLDRQYLSSTNGHPGEQINRLAIVSYLDHFRKVYFPNISSEQLPVSLDPVCYEDYASKLIPRAVGYSAGLLDYFFRGTIEISDFEMQINTLPGHYQTKVGFNKVTLYAKNASPDSENMEQGTVHLVVKYKVDENERFLHTPPHPSMEFQYITKQFEDVSPFHSIPGDDPKQFEFDLSGNPIPLNATEIYFYLIYRGTLGLEADGIGVGYAPFLESRIIDVGLSDEGVYALTDQDPTSIDDPTTQGFDSIVLAAKNVDPENRNMSGGTVQLVVKYLVAQEDQFQNPPPMTIFNFNYIVKELPGLQAIPDITSDPIKFEFDLSDSQIPLWATDIYLYLVYKGQIGLQEQAVAVGFKDISEPTLISYYNSMDKICIHGVMYDAGDQAYAIAVDLGQEDEWDVFPHDRENVYMRYSSFENPQSLTPSFDTYNYNIPYQAAGEYLKLFILTDYQFAENSSNGEIVVTDPRDNFDHYIGNYIGPVFGLSAIKNQIEVVGPDSPYYDPNQFVYLRGIPEFSQFRDIENSWWVFSLINRPLPEGSPENENCSFDE